MRWERYVFKWDWSQAHDTLGTRGFFSCNHANTGNCKKKPSGIQSKRMTISLNPHLEQQYIQLRTPTMTFTVLVLAVYRMPVTYELTDDLALHEFL